MNTSKRFQETCPLKLKNFPTHECQLAINRVNKDRGPLSCDWYICDAESHFCFWVWLAKKENQTTHTLQEIAELTRTSVNNIKLTESFAIKRFKKTLRQFNLPLDGVGDNYEYIVEYIKENCR